ncbi:hypothetical protein BSL78_18777 [Apostichopus japonicus]|uniref:Uncharacterized protein n=1 Tax=Stichopus japonicus TaxID=307972 RepID=A0A2G8K8U0_STIJA|nr:hypothetical protein BSL78_18777 [Apostichopus japonicus]
MGQLSFNLHHDIPRRYLLTLHASFSPMKDKFEQQLQLASLLAIFLNMLMVAVPAYETDSLFVKETMTFILIFLNIGVLGVTFAVTKVTKEKQKTPLSYRHHGVDIIPWNDTMSFVLWEEKGEWPRSCSAASDEIQYRRTIVMHDNL